MKSIIFVSLLVAAIAIPLAEAQILSTLLSPLPPLLTPLIPVTNPQLINITGTVFCSANASLTGPLPPRFPNATVELRCAGSAGTIVVVSNTTTTATGTFVIALNTNITLGLITSLLNGRCKVVVATPLANCNVTVGLLPGFLASSLQLPTPSPIPGVPTIPVLQEIIQAILAIIPGVLNLVTPSFALSASL